MQFSIKVYCIWLINQKLVTTGVYLISMNIHQYICIMLKANFSWFFALDFFSTLVRIIKGKQITDLQLITTFSLNATHVAINFINLNSNHANFFLQLTFSILIGFGIQTLAEFDIEFFFAEQFGMEWMRKILLNWISGSS